MKNNGSINLENLPNTLLGILKKFSVYKVLAFFLVVSAIYGYIVWRINVYSNIAPDTSEQTAQTTAAQPHIDPSVVEKIQSLQDNSVDVQSLFDEARNNPFQE